MMDTLRDVQERSIDQIIWWHTDGEDVSRALNELLHLHNRLTVGGSELVAPGIIKYLEENIEELIKKYEAYNVETK